MKSSLTSQRADRAQGGCDDGNRAAAGSQRRPRERRTSGAGPVWRGRRHILDLDDWEPGEIIQVLDTAVAMKRDPGPPDQEAADAARQDDRHRVLRVQHPDPGLLRGRGQDPGRRRRQHDRVGQQRHQGRVAARHRPDAPGHRRRHRGDAAPAERRALGRGRPRQTPRSSTAATAGTPTRPRRCSTCSRCASASGGSTG